MEKAVIIYASTHHGSTKKLADAIADRYDVHLIDATKQYSADLSEYDLIGFGSGIDFGKFYESVEQFLEKNLPENKRVFFLYTCARVSDRFTETIKTAARRKGAVILGEYGCRGFNTYGPWKLIGGMNKGHPSAEELQGAVGFFEFLLHT
ncbi:MAG: flavodoxin family protein [Oscillospiraceae bacterium]|nr:flavodoxin family protein [Oscillospiraceae bacterium]